jgi:hypothetical protein
MAIEHEVIIEFNKMLTEHIEALAGCHIPGRKLI